MTLSTRFSGSNRDRHVVVLGSLLVVSISLMLLLVSSRRTNPTSVPITAAVPRPEDLIQDLRNPDIDVREEAMAALKSMTPSILPLLKASLNDPDSEVRARCHELLLLAEAEPHKRMAEVNVRNTQLETASRYGDSVVEAVTNYAKDEGRANRAKRFSQLTGELAVLRLGGIPIPAPDLLDLLGPPDLYRDDGKRLLFVYFYNRFAEKDWVVHVYFTKGFVKTIGYNEAHVNKYEDCTPYK